MIMTILDLTVSYLCLAVERYNIKCHQETHRVTYLFCNVGLDLNCDRHAG